MVKTFVVQGNGKQPVIVGPPQVNASPDVPPGKETVVLKTTRSPRQIGLADAVIGATAGVGLTVTVAVALHEPILHVIIDVPALSPVIVTSPLRLTLPLFVVHTPPVAVSVTVPPTQTTSSEITGVGFTVTTPIAMHPSDVV